VFNHSSASPSDAAFRSGQLYRVESEFFAGSAQHAHVERLTRTAERNFRFSAFPMHGYHDLPLVPLLMLTVIDAAPLLHEPFSECGLLCSRGLSDLPRKRRLLPLSLIIAPSFLPPADRSRNMLRKFALTFP